MSTKIAKSKGRQEKPKLKVMHIVSKDENGNASITSKAVGQAPKLKETVGPKASKHAEKLKDEMTDEQRSILQALNDLGGKDVHSMDIAKKLGFDKKFPKAPRAPVRNAMERLNKLGFTTGKKAGVKYSFSITDKGKQVLSGKDKEAGSTKPTEQLASNPTNPPERPANTDIQCAKCNTFNPFQAEYCKNCGTQLRALQAATTS